MRSFEAFDAGSADLVSSLSERLQCTAVLSNFSKLIIDPSAPICNQDLIKLFYKTKSEDGELLEVTINNQGYRLYERLSESYLEYQKVMNEVMLFLEFPKIIISIHTHEPEENAE
jgi:predicted N-formylglutamate amidohydrolase